MTNDAALHSALERFFGITDLGHRQFLILLLRGQQRLDAETETKFNQVLEELKKMSETLQQQHDEVLAEVQAVNAEVQTIASNQAQQTTDLGTINTQLAAIKTVATNLEAWFAKNSGVGTNLVDFSDVKAAADQLKGSVDSAQAASNSISATISGAAATASEVVKDNPDPGPVPSTTTTAPATETPSTSGQPTS